MLHAAASRAGHLLTRGIFQVDKKRTKPVGCGFEAVTPTSSTKSRICPKSAQGDAVVGNEFVELDTQIPLI